jgi:hypothetical protein
MQRRMARWCAVGYRYDRSGAIPQEIGEDGKELTMSWQKLTKRAVQTMLVVLVILGLLMGGGAPITDPWGQSLTPTPAG